ncbi:MAG: S41 family peptidase [Deltaproteobacteria bacterium]|nr:S41 family peptidase [Deltaproteobacteria bacterium]
MVNTVTSFHLCKDRDKVLSWFRTLCVEEAMPCPFIRKALTLIVFTSLIHISVPCIARPDSGNPYAGLNLFAKILSYVEREYVEEVPRSKLIRGAILGMLQSLDPYSAYLTPEEVRKIRAEAAGKVGRTGLEEGLAKPGRDEPVVVISPIEDSPAWQKGIHPGDRLLEVDGKATGRLSIHKVITLLQGEIGTRLVLKVDRSIWPEAKPIEIERAKVVLPAVQSTLLAPNIAYFRLAFFRDRTDKELSRAIDNLQAESGGKLDGVVLDLRKNPGGLVKTAVAVADLFLDHGLILSTKGRRRREERFYAHRSGTKDSWPMVVLIDSGTASAAEIVAGTLKDHSRALIIGTRSFGKGSVQEIIGLPDGSALKLTTKTYYTPSHVSIQGRGITPDIIIAPGPAMGTPPPIREKDLAGHFKHDANNKPESAGKQNPDNGFTVSLMAKELLRDQQVKTALGYLKSWSMFKRAGKH